MRQVMSLEELKKIAEERERRELEEALAQKKKHDEAARQVHDAFFDETFVIPDPVQPDPRDPSKLIPYEGPPLTVGGELNKLATNLGQGRNWAGIHFRSDAAASLPQAEEVAIAILKDERATFRESFRGFELTRFDGTRASF